MLKLFVAVTSLAKAYGGPAHSVPRLAIALSAAGVNVGLWTPDQSAGKSRLLPSDVAAKCLGGTLTQAFAAFGRPDIIHDNGIWLGHNHQLSRLAARDRIPRMVSARGMLEPWAMQHKRLKKKIAWHLYQQADLKRARALHATATSEANTLAQLELGVPIAVIPNGVDVPQPNLERMSQSSTGDRTALFLGRIYPVKGLSMLIDAWAEVRPSGWRLRIAGPDEAGHRNEIEAKVAAAGLSRVVSFDGLLDDEAKRIAFHNSDLLILPSHSESFGIVVAEALAHGVPTLTTSGTPWTTLGDRGCGWCVAPSSSAIARGLAEAVTSEHETLRAMGARGRAWMEAEFGWDAVANQFIVAYVDCINSS